MKVSYLEKKKKRLSEKETESKNNYGLSESLRKKIKYLSIFRTMHKNSPQTGVFNND